MISCLNRCGVGTGTPCLDAFIGGSWWVGVRVVTGGVGYYSGKFIVNQGRKFAKIGVRRARESVRFTWNYGQKAWRNWRQGREAIINGKRHSGFYRNYAGRSARELKKGIRKFEKQIEKHKDKITSPDSLIENWNKLDPRQQNALINKKWPSDIRRLTEQKNILESLLQKCRK